MNVFRTVVYWVGGVALTVVLGIAALLVLTKVANDIAFPNWDGAVWIREAAQRIAADNPGHIVELAELAGHDVTQSCWVAGYFDVLPTVEAHGFPASGIPDIEAAENHYGLLMAGPTRTTYGEFSMYDVDEDAAYANGMCSAGTRLALVFDSIDPLAGGRIVDLGVAP